MPALDPGNQTVKRKKAPTNLDYLKLGLQKIGSVMGFGNATRALGTTGYTRPQPSSIMPNLLQAGAISGALSGVREGQPEKKSASDLALEAFLKSLSSSSRKPGGSLGRPNLPGVGLGQTAADLARARDLVQLEYGAKESGLNRAMGQERTTYDRLLADLNEAMKRETTVQQEYGKGADVKLQEIYGALQNELQGNLAKTQDIYSKGTQGIQQAYQQAGETQQGSAEKINQALQQRAQQLGIESATPEALAGLVSEQQGAVSRTAESGAAAQGNIIQAGTTEAGVQQRGISGASREAAQERANLALSVSDALAQINISGMKGKRDLTRGLQDSLTELGGQLADLRGERGVALREAVRQVSEARTAQERQRRLDALSEHIQMTQLDMQKEEQIQSQRDRKIEDFLLPGKLKLQQLEIENALAGANAPSISDEELAFLKMVVGTQLKPLNTADLLKELNTLREQTGR